MENANSLIGVSRDEQAFRRMGRAADNVKEIGERLIVAFQELSDAADAMTEERIADVKIILPKAIESAWATWRNDKNAIERAEVEKPDIWNSP